MHLRAAKILLFAVASAGLSFVHPQRSDAQAAIAAEPEVIVTAQRRPEPAQDVAISLSALSGSQLERLQVIDTPALDKAVPSLVMIRTGAFTQPYLRGVGKRSTLGVENSVASYVDGVYFASPVSALLDLRDVNRVEVLNGPQGTLFGRNTTGGVIQIVTRDPGSETSAEGSIEAGTYGYLSSNAYLSGGSDRFAGNISVSLSSNSGYGKNAFTGKTSEGKVRHSLAARTKWIWRPAGPLKLTVAADYQDFDHDFTQLPVAGFPPIGQPPVQSFRDGDQNTPSRYRFRYGGASARLDAELGDATFMSLSALRRMHESNSVDLDMGPLPLLAAAASARQNQFSQEFQLQSNGASSIKWLAGLYYIHLLEAYDPTVFEYGGSYSAQLGGRTSQTLLATGTTSSYAAFGQVVVPIGSATRLTLGLRYTIERRSVQATGERTFDNAPFIRPIPGVPLLTQEPIRSSTTFGEPTWTASLDRHFSDEVMAYVTASRGFQSGGWNLQTPQNPAFGPEWLDDLEGGVKFSGIGRHLTADAALFHYSFSNLQVSAITPAGSATVNAASARSYGLELQLNADLYEGASASFGFQLLKARFGHFPNATCTDYSLDAAIPYAPVACDVTGNRLPFSPRLKFNIAATDEISIGRTGTLVLSGNIAYNSGYFSEPDNVVRQGAFATLDARAEWRPKPAGPLLIRLWVLNLTDAHYYESLVTFPTAGVLQSPAAPRRVGLSLAYSI